MFRCQNCQNMGYKVSRFRWFEFPMALLLLRPFRCSHCSRRFFGFVWQEEW